MLNPMKLKYRSPMRGKYAEVGEIAICGTGTTADEEVVATMVDTDAFLDFATFAHGSDGGGLQLEIDEIGEKMVRAFNCHDELLAACKHAATWISGALDEYDGVPLVLRNLSNAIRNAEGV